MTTEIIEIKNFGEMIVGGLQVKTLEFLPESLNENLKGSKTKIVTTIVNHYGSKPHIKPIHEERGNKFFSDTITCWLGDLKINFLISVQKSHMVIHNAKVEL